MKYWETSEGEIEGVAVSYLTVIDGEVKMMQGVMCRTIDDVFERMAGYHIRVVDLKWVSELVRKKVCSAHEYAPKVDKNKEAEV